MENKNTNVLLVITLILTAAVFAFMLFNVSGARANVASPVNTDTGGTSKADDTVAVYGQGRITIKPDIAYITFGVENIDADPKKAQDYNSSQMDKVKAAVKNSGVAEPDIRTAAYNVNQEYDYINNVRKATGYKVLNLVQVSLKAIDNAGNIIKAAYDAGANRFEGIRFDLIERQKAYIGALTLAAGRALEKANELAVKAGRKISGVVEIEESNSGISTPYYSTYTNYSASSIEAPAGDYPGGLISSGEYVITAAVNIKYRLE